MAPTWQLPARPERAALAGAQDEALDRMRRSGRWLTVLVTLIICLPLTIVGSVFTVVGIAVGAPEGTTFAVVGPSLLLGAVLTVVVAVVLSRRRAALLRRLPAFDPNGVAAPTSNPWGLLQLAAGLDAALAETPYLVGVDEDASIRIQLAMHARDVPMPSGTGSGSLSLLVATVLTPRGTGTLVREDRGHSSATGRVAPGHWVSRSGGIYPGLPQEHALGGLRLHPSDLDAAVAEVTAAAGWRVVRA